MGTIITARRPHEDEAAGSSADEVFAASYSSSLGRLIGFFRAKGIARDEAADLANETMVRMLVHLRRHGRDRTDLGPLVRTIARNLLVERVRKQAPVLVPLADDIDVADEGLEPVDQLVASERREAVRAAIKSLAPRHRHVVGLWMDGRAPAEIARELGIKRNAVDAILHRARRSLASKLDGRAFGALPLMVGSRLRGLARRLSSFFVSTDPSGQTAAAASGLVAVGIAAVVSLAPSATAIGGGSVPVSSIRSVVSATPDVRSATPRTAEAAGHELADAAKHVRTTTREFSTSIPTGGDGGDVEVGLAERNRDDGQRSVLGPILSRIVTDNLCGASGCSQR